MDIVRLSTSNAALAQKVAGLFTEDPSESPSLSHLEGLLSDGRTYVLAALVEHEPVGFMLAYRFPAFMYSGNLAYLYEIEVLDAFRRRGIARDLLHALRALLEKDDVYELWLGTATDNVEGQAFFSKTGATRSKEAFNDFTYEWD